MTGRAAAFAARWDLPLQVFESGPGALSALPAVLAPPPPPVHAEPAADAARPEEVAA